MRKILFEKLIFVFAVIYMAFGFAFVVQTVDGQEPPPRPATFQQDIPWHDQNFVDRYPNDQRIPHPGIKTAFHSGPNPMPSPAASVPEFQLSGFPSDSFAQKRTLSIAEVRGIAVNGHPALQQAARQMEAIRGAWIQAGLKENPTIGYSGEEMAKRNTGKHGVEFGQVIVPQKKLSARQATIAQEYKVAKQVYESQWQKVVNDATLASYRVAFAQRKIQLLNELTQLSRESRRAAEVLFQSKEISRSIYLDMKIQSDRMDISLSDADIAYQTACKELSVLLSLPPDELLEISDPIDELPDEVQEAALWTQIRASSPELAQAYANVETAKARLQQECMNAGIDYDTNAKVAYNAETKLTEFSIGVAIPVRIFNRNQGNIQRARSEIAAAHQNVNRVEMQMAQRFQSVYGDYRTARQRVLTYRKSILGEAKESVDLALSAYKKGEYNTLELLDTQRTLSAVQIEYLDNLQLLLEKQILLNGALLTGGLDSPEN